MNKLIILLSLILLNSSCKTKEHELTNEEFITYFNSFNPEWKEAIVTSNSTYIIDRYTDNAIIGVPNKNFIIGKDRIRQYWGRNVEFIDDFWYKTQRIDGNTNDVFYETGIAFAKYKINNQIHKDTTKYLFVWKKFGDNNYKILAEMFNSIP